MNSDPEINHLSSTRILQFDPEEVQIDLILNDADAIEDDLHPRINQMIGSMGKPEFSGAIFSILQEMIQLGLNFLYQRLFHIFLLREMGMEDLEQEQWISLFEAEVAGNRSENFARLCRKENQFVSVLGRIEDEFFRIDVEFESDLTESRIAEMLKHSRSHSKGSIQDQSGTKNRSLDPSERIYDILEGLGVNGDHYQLVKVGNGPTTRATLRLPLRLFQASRVGRINLLSERDKSRDESFILNRLKSSIVRFNLAGGVVAVSSELLDTLGIENENIEAFCNFLPGRFYSEVFHGSGGVLLNGQFENYRLWMKNTENQKEVLFQISGVRTGERVLTLWQPVVIQEREKGEKLGEGSILEQLRIQKLLRPYVPSRVIQKAEDAVRLGKLRLPDEVRDYTILFADLAGFTRKSESMDPHRVIDLLNLVMGHAAHIIERCRGWIDKFMGDGILALFQNPKDAVQAALEMQLQFREINQFRSFSGEDPVEFRIGINTGRIIMANIGTRERCDWTPIGDAVNIASRIEKSSIPGRILVSEETFKRIQDQLVIHQPFEIHVKGKDREILVAFVRSMSWRSGKKDLELILE